MDAVPRVPKKGSTKCPNCNREIDHFNAECEATRYTQFHLNSLGVLDEYGSPDYDYYGGYGYKCPLCGAFITSDEGEATAMLMEEKDLRRFKAINDKKQQTL